MRWIPWFIWCSVFTNPCLMLYLFPFSDKICDSIPGTSQVRNPWQKLLVTRETLFVWSAMAIMLHASIIFLNWNWNQYTAGSAGSVGLSLFLFRFGETQCWQHGIWEKTNKTEIVVKHQIWEENCLEIQSSCPMCVMVDLEICPLDRHLHHQMLHDPIWESRRVST